jgi:4-hydroxy 2-oxovalerate aldolase
MDFKLLDCTLRDGGYYNHWDFNDDLVERYLQALQEANVDIVELGFRYAKKEGFLGQYAYLGEKKLQQLKTAEYQFDLAVMIEEGDISSHSEGSEGFVNQYFVEKSKSHVDLVRIAAHFDKVSNVIPSCETLKKLGYQVSVNIMQISRYDNNKVIEKLSSLREISCIDILYFADSLGDMNHEDVINLCEIYSKYWGKSFGFHGHNNCGKAVDNSLTASNNGCKFIDSTVTGMGRGAGNALTEVLLLETGRVSVKSVPKLVQLVLNDFSPMKKFYGWGESLTYYIAAKGQVHPTYVQTLETQRSDLRLSEMADIIGRLALRDSSSFNQSTLTDALYSSQEQKSSDGPLREKFSGQKILLLGPGNSLTKHFNAVRNYAEKLNSPIASCSVAIDLNSLPISHFICSSPRVQNFVASDKIDNQSCLFITPYDFSHNNYGLSHFRYKLLFKPDALEIEDDYCFLGNSKSLIYAISCCAVAGFDEIILAGFDGYGSNDLRTIEMSHWLDRIQSELEVSITSILPTAYPLKIDSVYSNYV